MTDNLPTYDAKALPPGVRAFMAALSVRPDQQAAAKAAAGALHPGETEIQTERRAQSILRAHRRRYVEDPAYREIFTAAWDLGLHAVEDWAARRAMEGWDDPVYQGGILVGFKHKVSDRVLIELLRRHFPHTWGTRKVEHSGSLQLGIASLSDDELERIARGQDPETGSGSRDLAPAQDVPEAG